MGNNPESQTTGQENGDVPVDRILTIPNLMSLFRLLLIPLIMWAFLKLENYWLVAGLLVLSGVTDVADGFVARHFNQVSNLGKMLDPVADKFTEGILMILLALRYPLFWIDVALFVLSAFLMSLWGLRAINRQHFVNAAHWYGKVTTVVLYTVIFVLLIADPIRASVANTLIIAAGVMIVGNVTAYGLFYRKLKKERPEDK